MKKIVILFSFVLMINTLNAQLVLKAELIDSIISNLYPFAYIKNELNDILIINIAMLENRKNSFYISATPIEYRQDVNENMKIYMSGTSLLFVILRHVEVDSVLRYKLINYNDQRFDKSLDSIKFGKITCSGCVIMRTPLEVFRVKRMFLSRNTYVITSKKYIPYLSAPDEFIPLNDGRESKEIEPWYYDYKPVKKLNKKRIPLMELNKKYYEDMKPREKIILKMPKDK